MFNLPNCITLSRIIFVIIFTIMLAFDSSSTNKELIEGTPFAGYFYAITWTKAVALWAFVLGAISDFFDGYFARKLNQVTNFGKLLDPLADKILVAAAFIYLSSVGYCPFWVSTLIIFREFLVTGLRQIAIAQGQVIAADGWGKWKTTFQLTFCIACMIHIAYAGNLPQPLRFLSQGIGGELLRSISLWGAVILTLWSGINYCWKSRNLLR